MVYLYYFITCLCVLSIILVIICILSIKYLWAQKIYCFLFDHRTYRTYKSIIDYNKIFNKSIPVYEDWATYNKELMENRYYIMDGDLYFGNECLHMKHMSLMMLDLFKRNSEKIN